ncbi:hybrid sensor histidine kinase/response regulator [uncultured Pseudomonas sp.]|uniref:hybrid sensor histidine kinase/response regulator n=1 Tax=uncultured Pseudomonas sp. TaxID=114707 RepID=UPI0025DA9399|nr:hybrid sensor histidine kinase/response regulator [uncultured Pseudomonas sp.]
MNSAAQRIVIIDDTEANRYVLRKILESQARYQVCEAASGTAGLAMIDDDVHLVIIDVNLPDMTGFELIQAIERQRGRGRLPAIINISATFVSGQDKARGFNTGAQAYLTHPINPDEVLATVAALLKASSQVGHMEQQRNSAIARSENLQAEKVMLERFMRSLNHDLRSPLTAATMVVNLMQRNPSRRTDDLLQTLHDNLQRMNQMITDVLDITHMSLGGGVRLSGESLLLGPLLTDAAANLRLQFANSLDLRLDTPELEVRWDRYAFLRIFDNLVLNAAKHGEAGTPIQVRQTLAEGGVIMELRNRGQFPAEVLANLATPYFISTRSDKRGWGLGLPIVKALSESFGGEARFANGDGEVVITLSLPLRLS